MNINVKIINLDRTVIADLIKILFLIGFLTIVPVFHNQMVTGPLVNAILFIATYLFNIRIAVLIGLIPSAVALSIGLLSPVLGPMVPFIMTANILLVISFNYFKNKNYWLGIGISSLLKFVFLSNVSLIVFKLIVKKEIAVGLANMMGWPQLITSLTGGLIAYVFLRKIRKI